MIRIELMNNCLECGSLQDYYVCERCRKMRDLEYLEFIEKLASVLRKLGGPDIENLILLVEDEGVYYYILDETVLGIPVYVVGKGSINEIGLASRLDNKLDGNFEKLWFGGNNES